MIDLIKPRRKHRFSERIQIINKLVNEKGELSVEDLVREWGLVPHYIRSILKWSVKLNSCLEYDDEKDCIFIPERRDEVESSK